MVFMHALTNDCSWTVQRIPPCCSDTVSNGGPPAALSNDVIDPSHISGQYLQYQRRQDVKDILLAMLRHFVSHDHDLGAWRRFDGSGRRPSRATPPPPGIQPLAEAAGETFPATRLEFALTTDLQWLSSLISAPFRRQLVLVNDQP